MNYFSERDSEPDAAVFLLLLSSALSTSLGSVPGGDAGDGLGGEWKLEGPAMLEVDGPAMFNGGSMEYC
jgi:hypothetical protein